MSKKYEVDDALFEISEDDIDFRHFLKNKAIGFKSANLLIFRLKRLKQIFFKNKQPFNYDNECSLPCFFSPTSSLLMIAHKYFRERQKGVTYELFIRKAML